MLVSKPYDSYVLMATKEIDGQYFEIPSKVYKRMIIQDNGEKITFYFTQKEE